MSMTKMSMTIQDASVADFAAPSLRAALRVLRRNLSAAFFDTYRPELHYMRGPGPKWREKHGAAARLSASGADQGFAPFHQATA